MTTNDLNDSISTTRTPRSPKSRFTLNPGKSISMDVLIREQDYGKLFIEKFSTSGENLSITMDTYYKHLDKRGLIRVGGDSITIGGVNGLYTNVLSIPSREHFNILGDGKNLPRDEPVFFRVTFANTGKNNLLKKNDLEIEINYESFVVDIEELIGFSDTIVKQHIQEGTIDNYVTNILEDPLVAKFYEILSGGDVKLRLGEIGANEGKKEGRNTGRIVGGLVGCIGAVSVVTMGPMQPITIFRALVGGAAGALTGGKAGAYAGEEFGRKAGENCSSSLEASVAGKAAGLKAGIFAGVITGAEGGRIAADFDSEALQLFLKETNNPFLDNALPEFIKSVFQDNAHQEIIKLLLYISLLHNGQFVSNEVKI